MAAATRKSHSKLFGVLNQRFLQSYTTRAFLQTEKSLEFVQSMIIAGALYIPLENCSHRQNKYHEFIQMAVTMALDLNLGNKLSQEDKLESWYSIAEVSNRSEAPVRMYELNDNDRESRRTYFSC